MYSLSLHNCLNKSKLYNSDTIQIKVKQLMIYNILSHTYKCNISLNYAI